MDQSIFDAFRVPAHCPTGSGGEAVRALLGRQGPAGAVTNDASGGTRIGPGVLPVLVAGQIDCQRRKRAFVILDPSPAFVAAARTSRFDGRFDIHLDLVRE